MPPTTRATALSATRGFSIFLGRLRHRHSAIVPARFSIDISRQETCQIRERRCAEATPHVGHDIPARAAHGGPKRPSPEGKRPVRLLHEPCFADAMGTPRREIDRKGKARLYQYGGAPRHGTPLLFVPNLGISCPWVFDLLPGRSFVEYLVAEGFDFYLLDWGVFGPEDDHMTFEHCVAGILPRMCRQVLETSQARDLSIIGYCMGAAMTLSLAASRPELPLRAFVNMAGPVDFSRAGLLARWLDRRWIDVDRLVDTLGSIPPALIWLGGTLLRPTAGISAMLDLWYSLGDERRVDEFRAAFKWVREFVGIPGEFFRQWVRDFYQDNLLYRGALSVGGRPAPLQAITCPVLAVAARDDPVAPPESVSAMLDVVGSHDKTWIQARGSHLSLVIGTEATQHLWPAISRWLASHDSRPPKGSR